MKPMKIALSFIAIAAIAAIYSTGAFVPQTHGIENTFAGFIILSDAEMAQNVGGPEEGHRRQNTVPVDHDVASCGSSNPDCDKDRQTRDAILYACDPCPEPVFDNYDNTYYYYDKHSIRKSDGNILYEGLRISSFCKNTYNGCEREEFDEGSDFDKPIGNGKYESLPGKRQTCNVSVGKCD